MLHNPMTDYSTKTDIKRDKTFSVIKTTWISVLHRKIKIIKYLKLFLVCIY